MLWSLVPTHKLSLFLHLVVSPLEANDPKYFCEERDHFVWMTWPSLYNLSATTTTWNVSGPQFHPILDTHQHKILHSRVHRAPYFIPCSLSLSTLPQCYELCLEFKQVYVQPALQSRSHAHGCEVIWMCTLIVYWGINKNLYRVVDWVGWLSRKHKVGLLQTVSNRGNTNYQNTSWYRWQLAETSCSISTKGNYIDRHTVLFETLERQRSTWQK